MSGNMRFNLTTYLLFIAAMLSGCTDAPDMPDTPGTDTSTPISFDVTAVPPESAEGSRANTITYPSDITSLRLFAPLWENTGSGYVFRFYEIADETVSRNDDGTWSTSRPYYWPDRTKALSFFAYAPVDIEGWEMVSMPHSSPDRMRFFYTPPKDARDQHDIVFASDTRMLNYAGSPEKSVSLTFMHILANIQFRINGDATTVSSITLNNLYSESGFSPNGNYWDRMNRDNTAEAAKTSYTVYIPEDGSMGDDQRLIIIPQQPTAYDATITVTMRDGTSMESSFAYRSLMSGALTIININLPATGDTSRQLTSQLTIASTR